MRLINKNYKKLAKKMRGSPDTDDEEPVTQNGEEPNEESDNYKLVSFNKEQENPKKNKESLGQGGVSQIQLRYYREQENFLRSNKFYKYFTIFTLAIFLLLALYTCFNIGADKLSVVAICAEAVYHPLSLLLAIKMFLSRMTHSPDRLLFFLVCCSFMLVLGLVNAFLTSYQKDETGSVEVVWTYFLMRFGINAGLWIIAILVIRAHLKVVKAYKNELAKFEALSVINS